MKTLIIIIAYSVLMLSSFFIKANIYFFKEPDAGYRPVLQAIYSAKHSINIEMYLMKDKKIIRALKEKAKSGVKINILLERKPYGSPDNTQARRLKRDLAKYGIHVRWSSPHFSLTHEKMMLIDHQKALIMTLNQTYSAFHYNREFGVIDTDKSDALQINRVFKNDWYRKKASIKKSRLLWSPQNSEKKLLALIDSAKHSITIETEELTDAWIIHALKRQAKRGINIKLILPNCHATSKSIPNAKVKYLDVNSGQLYIHAKAMIIDDKKAYIGSQNLTYPSLKKNRELGIILNQNNGYQERGALRILKNTLDHDWRSGFYCMGKL